MHVYEGQLNSEKTRVAIVAGRFNGLIVDQLVSGVGDAVRRTGGANENVTLYWAPGAFEIPQLLRAVVGRGNVDAIVCVGAVIRGATPHFDYISGAVAQGVAAIARESDVPIGFGVLTCDTIEQALERAGTKAGNKGYEAALAAIEMMTLMRRVRD